LTKRDVSYDNVGMRPVFLRALSAMLLFCGACDGGSGGETTPPARDFDAYPANLCVGEKQEAASRYCNAVLAAWATAEDEAGRAALVGEAREALSDSWDAAESSGFDAGVDCSDLALTAEGAAGLVDRGVDDIVAQLTQAAGDGADDPCTAALLEAAGSACLGLLDAESVHVRSLATDRDRSALADARGETLDALAARYSELQSSGCATDTSVADLESLVISTAAAVVRDTLVSPGLDDRAYTALEPGPTNYEGRTFTPQCFQGADYRYFARRGSSNKLLIYYQGGGACWNALSCGIPTCRGLPNENLDEFASEGFFDLDDERNPFRDWNIVFVSYCTCDIHFGDATPTYVDGGEATRHLGFHNAKVAEKWAREHFLNPDAVFVTGSSAGAYGAWFHGPLLHEVWPASQMHVLADAGNGVITEDFLENEFGVWNFAQNLPDIDGVREAITEGGGITAYTAAVASEFPETNWAHYTAFYDGSPGGQSGFYNVMLNGGIPTATLSWWEASCAFGEIALEQSVQTYGAVPENYRYYFATGTEHTVFRFPKVYTDDAGGVPLLVNWVSAMLKSGASGLDPAWENVLCENCGLLLDDDPRPAPLEPPFVQRGDAVTVVCD
jgi:hypothetical protein